MDDVSQIRTALFHGVFTADDLAKIGDALTFARSQLSKRTVRSLREGDSVQFTSPKSGVTFKGTVAKVKIKYILVATPQGRYNVPANLVEAV